jgi:HipA-like protein
MQTTLSKVLKAEVLSGKTLVGILSKHIEPNKTSYTFQYDEAYCLDDSRQPLVPNMPKRTEVYYSDYLFPIFFGLVSEGSAKEYQCKYYKIDPEDHFSLLLKTCRYNTLFGLRIKEIQTKKVKKDVGMS